MAPITIVYFRNAAYLNAEAARYLPPREEISTRQFFELHRAGEISALATFEILNPRDDEPSGPLSADELYAYLSHERTCQP